MLMVGEKQNLCLLTQFYQQPVSSRRPFIIEVDEEVVRNERQRIRSLQIILD